MYEMVRGLTPILCPLIPHTAQEIWQHHVGHHNTFVQEEAYTPVRIAWIDDALEQKWTSYKSVRNEVLKALETERKSKRITNSLEAHVHLFANEAFRAWIETFPEPMHALFLVSAVTVHTDEQLSGDAPHLARVEVTRAVGGKCARCWNVTPDVGGDPRHPTICARCAEVLARATS
jgi:isoleucyl-tRNA synthetase